MRRWGQITEAKPDAWYVEAVAKVYRPDLYLQAARLLVNEQKAEAPDCPWGSDGYRAPQVKFIDGAVFDGRRPNEYLAQFVIGLKSGQRIENGRPRHLRALRVCPKTSGGITKFSEHEAD